MNALSWVLFIVGTLVAAAAGAHSPPAWTPFGVGIALAVVGAVLLRRSGGSVAGGSDGDGVRDLAGLKAALGELRASAQRVASTPAEGRLAALEGLLTGPLVVVIGARTLLAQAHGVEAYALVYTPVASGERCLNRAWSALADARPDEAEAQVHAAVGHLDAALAAWPSQVA